MPNIRFEDWEAEQMEDPEFRAAVEELEPAYQAARLRTMASKRNLVFEGIDTETLRTFLSEMDCSLDFYRVYGPCNRAYKLVGARLTGITEPHYNLLERLIRWVGDKLNLNKLTLFHEKATSYHFTCERVEYPDLAPEQDDDWTPYPFKRPTP